MNRWQHLARKNKTLIFGLQVGIGIVIYLLLNYLLIIFESSSDQASISNWQNALWYTLVTLCTVGYGDLVPVTVYGRIIGFIFVIASLGIYGILIGKISSIINNINENKKLGYQGTDFSGHAVVIGWNEFGRMVTDQLMGVGKQVVIVTDEKNDVELIHDTYHSKNIFVLFSDFKNFEHLKKANIEESGIVFINLNDDTEKLVYVLNLKKYFADLEFVVTLENSDLKGTFQSAGVANAISKNEIASKLLASYMFEQDVANYSESIMTFARSDSDYDMKQFLVTPSNPYVNMNYQDAFFDLKKKYNAVLIGLTKRDKFGKRKLLKNPTNEFKISLGDYMIMIVNGKSFKVLQKIFQVEEGFFKEPKVKSKPE